MSRNGTGTYSVPNTFSSGAIITASSHNQNWTDIAAEMSNSLAVDGQSVMTGQVKGKNGDATSPSYSFGSDTNLGFFRKGADQLGITANGSEVGYFSADGLTITGTLTPSGQIVTSAGDASAPGISFAGDLDNGLYLIGADNVGMSIGGTKIVDYSATGVAITGTLGASGNFAVATSKFTVDATTGNAVIAGTLGVTGDFSLNSKFTVTASSGNVSGDGTLTFAGAATLNNAAGVTARNTMKAGATFSVSGTTVSFTASTQGFNVASVTRTGEGTFTIAFTNNLPTANYYVVATGTTEGAAALSVGTASDKTTSGFTLTTRNLSSGTNTVTDPSPMDFAVFGF